MKAEAPDKAPLRALAGMLQHLHEQCALRACCLMLNLMLNLINKLDTDTNPTLASSVAVISTRLDGNVVNLSPCLNNER